MPIILRFATPVQNRAEVERSLEVRASAPVTGAWHWFSGTDVVFRTRSYWPAHTRVGCWRTWPACGSLRAAYGAQDVARTSRSATPTSPWPARTATTRWSA